MNMDLPNSRDAGMIYIGVSNWLGIGGRAMGLGGCSSPDSGKTIIFRAKAKFFGQKPAAKNEKNCIY